MASQWGEELPCESGLRELLEPQGLAVMALECDSRGLTRSRQLVCGVMCRTFNSAGDVTRLCGGGGEGDDEADATVGVALRVIGAGPLSAVPVLFYAIDDPTNSAVPFWRFGSRRGELQSAVHTLHLPRWPSRELQAAVLEALIEAGADVNETLDHIRVTPPVRPIRVATAYANVAAAEVLIRHGAHRGVGALVLPGAFPDEPSREYEDALLDVYHRMLTHDRTLATERILSYRTGRHGEQLQGHGTVLHSMALSDEAATMLSARFVRRYLKLVVDFGADLNAVNEDGMTPLQCAALNATPVVVEWLCERLGSTQANGRSLLMAAGTLLSKQLSDGAPEEAIRRQRRVVRVLLEHGASIDQMPTAGPHQRFLRSLVIDAQREMRSERRSSNAASASPSSAQLDKGPQQPSSSNADTCARHTRSTSAAPPASAAASSSASASVPSTAERWKSAGNALFKADKYLDAYRSYLKGIRMERETIAELLIRRSQCLIVLDSYLAAFIDVTTALRILPPPHSIEPGTKYAILQHTAEIVYKPLIAQLTGAAYNDDDQDVDLPSKGAIAALMTDAMTQLCSTDQPVVDAPQQVTDALTEGEQLQDGERFADARDVFTAGLAAADVSTLVALLSNAAACLLQPKLIKEGGPDAVGCAAAAFHLSCLKGPCQQLSVIQQKTLIRLGQGLLAERLFDAADAVVQALTNHELEGQMAADITTLQRRIRTHAANATGNYDWAAIYRQAMGSAQNRQLGRTTPIDVAEYVGPVGFSPPAPDSQPALIATANVRVGQLLTVQKAVVVERASSQDSGRFDERLVARLASQCDVWHPRLVSQLCCLPPGRGQPSAVTVMAHRKSIRRAAPAPETCLGLTVEFPLLPRVVGSPNGEEFGPPVAQMDSDPGHLRRLLDFNIRTPDDIIETSIQGSLPPMLMSGGVWPLPSLLNHAGMKRNAIWYCVEDLLIVRAVRPIARGNEVTVSYWDQLDRSPSEERAIARHYQLPEPQYSPHARMPVGHRAGAAAAELQGLARSERPARGGRDAAEGAGAEHRHPHDIEAACPASLHLLRDFSGGGGRQGHA